MTTDLERAAEAIDGASALALACHVAPDGDALGSTLALHLLCRANGKASVASWPEPWEVAPHYRYLPGLELATKAADFPAHPEVAVTFDCGSLERLCELGTPLRAADTLIVIDHHASNSRFGTINVVEPEAAATAVLVRALARELGWELDRDVAMCLYTGLVTDTGRFQYQNTTPEVFRLAAELAAFDLPIAAMTRQLFEEHRFEYLQLMAQAIGRARLDRDLGFVATWLTREDLTTTGVDFSETEGLIDIIRRTGEAEVSCVAKDTDEGVRVSLRSVSEVDVGAIAQQFGGGGHRFAAGFTVPGPIDRVLDDVRAALAARRAGA